jgi:hypothetical protein
VAAHSFRFPTQAYLRAAAPAALLFGRGVELDFGVPPPGAIFKLAPQGVVNGHMGIFM